MNRLRTSLLVLALSFLPSLARAHTPIEGVGFFYGGMLHPLVIPAHLLLLVGAGLWIGQQGIRHIEVGLPAFVAGLALGLPCAGLGYVTFIPAPFLVAPAALAGLWVASAWPLPREAIGVGALAAGLLIGLDSAPGTAEGRDALFMLIGVALGAGFLLIHELALVEFFRRPWQRIAVRVLGSWVAAIALMVLALSFAPERRDSEKGTAGGDPAEVRPDSVNSEP